MTKKCIKIQASGDVKRKKVKALSEHTDSIENKNIPVYTLYQREQGG